MKHIDPCLTMQGMSCGVNYLVRHEYKQCTKSSKDILDVCCDKRLLYMMKQEIKYILCALA